MFRRPSAKWRISMPIIVRAVTASVRPRECNYIYFSFMRVVISSESGSA